MKLPLQHPQPPACFRLPKTRGHRALCSILLAAIGVALRAGEPFTPDFTKSFADLSLEELMNETITSVARREQRLGDAAAAISVLTNEDLRRSGATSIADALRLVPGMSVASVRSNEWAISARGYNNIFANKLLVLVDGRAVYSPLFAGVHWDLMQPVLEDVDRVEVIRGPGATVWGANAVNGVINVVTRGAKDTQGGLLYGSAGDVNETNSGARYGGTLGERTYYSVHFGAFAKDDYLLPNGQSADDSWQGQHGGFRVDHHPDDETQLTWQAGGVALNADSDATEAVNANTLARLTKRWSDRSSLEAQVYYDRTLRNEAARIKSGVDTVDVSVQHTFGLGERNDVIWGFGYRFAEMKMEETSFDTLVMDESAQSNLYSFFVQDELRIVPERLALTGGVKIEHNDYTGFEVQPGVRATLKPAHNQTLWAAVSRAVRTPAAFEGEALWGILAGPPFPGPGGLYVPRIVGNADLRSEELTAYEVGYRIQPTARMSVDLALFYNDYENLVGLGNVATFVPGVPIGSAEMPFVNHGGGQTQGGEIAVTVSPTDSWRISASYSLLLVDLPGNGATNPYERSSARNQVVLRSMHDFGRRFSVDAQLRYVDTLQSVPAYLTADVRLAYRFTDNAELSLVGQNLFDSQHPEQAPFYLTAASEVPRGYYAKLTWRF